MVRRRGLLDRRRSLLSGWRRLWLSGWRWLRRQRRPRDWGGLSRRLRSTRCAGQPSQHTSKDTADGLSYPRTQAAHRLAKSGAQAADRRAGALPQSADGVAQHIPLLRLLGWGNLLRRLWRRLRWRGRLDTLRRNIAGLRSRLRRLRRLCRLCRLCRHLCGCLLVISARILVRHASAPSRVITKRCDRQRIPVRPMRRHGRSERALRPYWNADRNACSTCCCIELRTGSSAFSISCCILARTGSSACSSCC